MQEIPEQLLQNKSVHIRGMGTFYLKIGVRHRKDADGHSYVQKFTDPNAITARDLCIEGIGFRADPTWNRKVSKAKQPFERAKTRHQTPISKSKLLLFVDQMVKEKGYVTVQRQWKKGDVVTLAMPMETKIMEANPLVEESRGQVAVQRGPIIYCLESNDLNGADIDNIVLPASAQFKPVETRFGGHRMMALETEAVDRGEASWQGTLYREVGKDKKKVNIRLIPYYAWGNRGKSEMTVWMPVEY